MFFALDVFVLDAFVLVVFVFCAREHLFNSVVSFILSTIKGQSCQKWRDVVRKGPFATTSSPGFR